MTIVLVEVVPLIFERLARLMCALPPRPPSSHQRGDVGLVHSKGRPPAPMLPEVLTHLPGLKAVDADSDARCVEGHVIDQPQAMRHPCRTGGPGLMTHPPGLLGCLPRLAQRAVLTVFAPEKIVAAVIMPRGDVRRMGTAPIVGDDALQMRMSMAQRGEAACGRIALTISQGPTKNRL